MLDSFRNVRDMRQNRPRRRLRLGSWRRQDPRQRVEVRREMGFKERRDRERTEMRQAILHAASEIAAQEGWHAVTIRRVAERIEYSPPTIYEYFESKEALLEAEA